MTHGGGLLILSGDPKLHFRGKKVILVYAGPHATTAASVQSLCWPWVSLNP